MAQPTVPSMQDLLTAGSHFGHKVSRAHPKMREYIFGARDGISIIDLEKTEKLLKEAVQGAYQMGKDGKVLLIVGTKKQAQEIVENLAKEADTPYLNERWVGGMLTNFEEMRKKIRTMVALKADKEAGKLSRTKKEQLLLSRKLEKFNKEYRGIVNMTKLPDAIFLVDAVSDNTAVKEALRMNINMIGLSDTNADPNWFEFPVPANDDGIKSISIICEAIIKAYAQGKKEAGHTTNEAKKVTADNDQSTEKAEAPKNAKKNEEVKDSNEVIESTEIEEEEIIEPIESETAILEDLVEKEEIADAKSKS